MSQKLDSVKRTNEEWVKLFEQQRMNGHTLKAWCAENNISLSTMLDRILSKCVEIMRDAQWDN